MCPACITTTALAAAAAAGGFTALLVQGIRDWIEAQIAVDRAQEEKR